MQTVKVTCHLPPHHPEYCDIDSTASEVMCPNGATYTIEDVDKDELTEFWADNSTDKLRVVILVDIKHCGWESSSYHQFTKDGSLKTGVGSVTIIDVTVPGMLVDFYDIAASNEEAESYLLKLVESR